MQTTALVAIVTISLLAAGAKSAEPAKEGASKAAASAAEAPAGTKALTLPAVSLSLRPSTEATPAPTCSEATTGTGGRGGCLGAG